ncbi:conserved hypothetical protein [Escherichia albertii TW07627]|uniref:Uncharacterized protein n=1 Tax=Escherichia albertii (strain TW07627) TaxID=502347 RepID=A0ABC9NRR9_ESCAT|nr:conserved hypothetical protein [Escherichia albertii TW07627]
MRRERRVRPTKFFKFNILQGKIDADKRSASGNFEFVINL